MKKDFERKEIYIRKILSSLKMLKDFADFVSMEFEFPELESKTFQHNFLLFADQMLKVRKFQKSEKEAFEKKKFILREYS